MEFLSLAGGKYLLVLDGGVHADFGGSPRPTRGPRAGGANPHINDVVKRATVAFWKATLLGDAEARRFLDGGGLAALLAPGDRFEGK